MWICPRMCVWVSECVGGWLAFYLCVPFFLLVCISLSVCVSVCLPFLFASLLLFNCASVCLSLFVCLSYVAVYSSLSFSLSFCLYVPLYFLISLSLSCCLSLLYLYVYSLLLYVFIFLFVCLSLSHITIFLHFRIFVCFPFLPYPSISASFSHLTSLYLSLFYFLFPPSLSFLLPFPLSFSPLSLSVSSHYQNICFLDQPILYLNICIKVCSHTRFESSDIAERCDFNRNSPIFSNRHCWR